MLKRIANYARGVGLDSVLKTSENQIAISRLVRDCPICHGEIENCQVKECYRTWRVYGESNRIDLHDPYNLGPLLFESKNYYWKVIPEALDNPDFFYWDKGGFIIKKTEQPSETI